MRKLTRVFFIVALYIIAIVLIPVSSLAKSDLITELREAFGISFIEATDEQLKQFLKDKNNKVFIEAMLKQLKHGKELQRFLDNQTNVLPKIGKEATKYLSKKLVLGILQLIGDKGGISWLEAGSQLIGVLSTISQGVNIFLKLSDALVAFDSREMLWMYIKHGREDGQSPTILFQDLYDTFKELIDRIICLKIPFKCLKQGGVPTEEDKQNFATYLEFSYQSWKLVNDQGRRDDVKRYILDNLPKPPIANAGPDQTVQVGSTVQLDGSASSDPDGDQIKRYLWTILPRENTAQCIFKSSRTIVNPKIMPLQEGICTIQLIVNDGKLNSAPDQVVITARRDITPLPTAPWPMFQHDAQHTSRSQYSGPAAGGVVWTSDIGSAVANKFPRVSQPVIDRDGVLYLGVGYDDGTLPGKLYAINPDGKLKWISFDLEGVPTVPAIGSDGTLYVGTVNYQLGLTGVVYAINPVNGTEKWRFRCEEQGFIQAITLGLDGTLYFACGVRLYALNPDGTEKWRYQATNQNFFLPPAIGPDGTIYTVDSGFCNLTNAQVGWIHALNPDGSLKWRNRYGDYGLSAPSIGPDGTIYVVTGGQCGSNGLSAISQNGEQIWFFSEGGFDWVGISPDGTIIAGARNAFLPGQCCRQGGYIYAFNSKGEKLWTFERENESFFGLSIDVNAMVFISSQISNTGLSQVARVYAVKNGIEQWSIDVQGVFSSSPVIGSTRQLYVPFIVKLSEYGEQRQTRLYALGENTQTQSLNEELDDARVIVQRKNSGEILFAVPMAAYLEVKIFNLAGSRIYDSGLIAGSSLRWSGITNDGRQVANGVYLYVITTRGWDGTILRSEVKKLIILR